jgi:uncharacterized membrane protein (UPF0136 family)
VTRYPDAMPGPVWLSVASLLYGVIIFVGGPMGYKMAGSVVSLVMGCGLGLLVIVGAALSRTNARLGFGIVGLAALIVLGVFILRYVETRKMMPAGMSIVLSLLMLGALFAGHFLARPSGPTPPAASE